MIFPHVICCAVVHGARPCARGGGQVGRPWAVLPQWSDVVRGLLEGLASLGVTDCDVVRPLARF